MAREAGRKRLSVFGSVTNCIVVVCSFAREVGNLTRKVANLDPEVGNFSVEGCQLFDPSWQGNGGRWPDFLKRGQLGGEVVHLAR